MYLINCCGHFTFIKVGNDSLVPYVAPLALIDATSPFVQAPLSIAAIKYSVIIPFYHRSDEFWTSLISYRNWYPGRDDYELIVIEDKANIEDEFEHGKLLGAIESFPDINIKLLASPVGNQPNPVIARNLGSREASGEILIHTSPEIYHTMDILSEFDKLFKNHNAPVGWGPSHPDWKIPSKQNKYSVLSNIYVVCACKSCFLEHKRVSKYEYLNPTPNPDFPWYQHTEYNNRILHWYSAMLKSTYLNIGGFDEKYSEFISYDDDDFRENVKQNKIEIVCRDDLVVIHVEHPRNHQKDEAKTKAGLEYYRSKW